ncbi:origin recognition complex subunit 2 [Elgaria multicarinata webbii]|uniref:origin recognition complex subunit 2 n=1 Tax=Elgaria multicarinata webbii TaxID=159646 RepID=UPI002FCD0D39
MSNPKIKKNNVLEVTFVADEDVLKHISESAGPKVRKNKASHTLDVKRWVKNTENSSDDEVQDNFEEQDYVSVLGIDAQESLRNGSSAGGGDVFSFQTPKRSNKMAEMACELAHKPGRNVKHDSLKNLEKEASTPTSSKKYSASSKGQEESQKNECVSTTPYRLRKRITASTMCSDSESDYSASCSEEEEEEEEEDSCRETADGALHPEMPATTQTTNASVNKETPAKKLKKGTPSNLVEEYFEAHSSSKVLTSDRTLQKLQKKKLDQESLQNLLNKVPVAFEAEREELTKQHESLFYKWMLHLHLGFNIVLYGLGSKRDLLENFRISLLQDSAHIVVNGFFPSITVKSILNSLTEEVLDHVGTFRSPQDQLDFIMKRFKEDPSLELYLLIHNLDSQMLRGDKSQQILGQLSSLPNIYLIASIDHINAPLMWDQAKQSMYNWLWYETTTYSPYIEETSYENSLLIQQSGSLALSSLTHVLRSLTPNARGIFRLLVEYQLENKDNPSYPGLSFQDFYQQCREAFLVNSNLTLRAQLTEFRDHKLIRTKRGSDGVEYLLIPVDNGTLTDFLQENNDI